MSREDWEVFDAIKEERKLKRRARLKRTNDFGWLKYTEHHWYRKINGKKLDYWPSSNKWCYEGKYYRGGLPKWLGELIDADNERIRKQV